MTEAGTITVTARVAFGTKETLRGLKPLFKAERERAKRFAREPEWSTEGLSGREAAAKRAQWEMFKEHLRETGELVDTLDVLVACGVRAELAERGWDREWPPVPAQALLPGRWPGSRDGAWPEGVTVRLPSGLVNTVWSACWHTSEEAIGQLRDWRDRYPDALPNRRFRSEGEDEALAEYERLAAQVTTAGAIWRAGVRRGIDSEPTISARIAS
ncbi:hypothetical protein [Streptomyces sp. AgN23]|uniref:hypothetical protein n=1 Tax=Streptomyces sp. AgN23 TaxID=1188315 RepID=UPI001B335FD4|nr:hypothetical protein [Streptomyces sp. AgN23]QTI87210.1 hypothetical protein AS97_39605 [Streptomyces sp. AgN23]WTB02796.1 hypothetical protein OG546_00030 [Streptomyces antimycoticus]WTB11324.1 hypothetical protein OG546_49090 [Streptomyces antimycoticus]